MKNNIQAVGTICFWLGIIAACSSSSPEKKDNYQFYSSEKLDDGKSPFDSVWINASDHSLKYVRRYSLKGKIIADFHTSDNKIAGYIRFYDDNEHIKDSALVGSMR